MRRACLVLAALVTLASASLAEPALAAYPGANGKIAYHTDFSQEQIFVVNNDGSGVTQLTSTQRSFGPNWSPSGDRIAFTSSRDDPNPTGCYPTPGCNYEIYVMNADGSGQTNLTNNPAQDGSPTWSPDGTKLAFLSNRSGHWEVHTMLANGSGETKVTNGFVGGDLKWSPRGDKFAFIGAQGLYTMNIDGTGVTALPTAYHSECGISKYTTFPNWSPDGQKIVVEQVEDDGGECGGEAYFFLEKDAVGGGERVIGGGYVSGQPAYSPDGRKLAYWSCCDSFLVVADLQGGGNLIPLDSIYPAPDWQPLRPPGYARPKGAQPTQVTLVPAYKACTSPNHEHGPPLAVGSCRPVQPASSYLTVGTFDSNGAAPNSSGYVHFRYVCNPPAPLPTGLCTNAGEQADVELTASLTDVRNKTSLSDYTGELRVLTSLRITDRLNGAGGVHPATATDTPFGFTMTCLPTDSASIGSTCSATTHADAVMPGIVLEDKRAVWQLGKVQVYDGGADGDADTTGDNTLFMEQGLFAP